MDERDGRKRHVALKTEEGSHKPKDRRPLAAERARKHPPSEPPEEEEPSSNPGKLLSPEL